MTIEKDRNYLVPEVASFFRCSKFLIYRKIRNGELKAIRFGGHFLIPGRAILELLDNHDPRKYAKRYA